MAAPTRQNMPPPRGVRHVGSQAAAPAPKLGFIDAIGLIVGIVVGAGIFRTPSLVAANAATADIMLLAWLLGGVVSMVGALCYAELASAYPDAGGEYHYLTRAYGKRFAFLFAWARIAVIQTGSIALLSFVFGDYASNVFPIAGEWSTPLYAALVVAALTGLNVIGVRQGARTQNVLTAVEVVGLMLVIGAGFAVDPPPARADAGGGTTAFGLVMVFVLLTYGGWNEAGYIAAELHRPRRTIARALLWSISIITVLYILVNVAYVRALGLSAMADSTAVAADLMRRAGGEQGAQLISVLVAVSALTSANASVFTGARANYALGRDFAPFAALGRWSARAGTPATALVVQGAIALALVGLGTLTRRGFETMVEYTAPVFWLFFLMVGVALLVLRAREPHVPRPFRVPGYPVTPLLFCGTAAYLLYSSLAYTGLGALVGVAVLLVGAMVLLVAGRKAGARSSA